MIRPIDIRLNAAHPELPLAEAVTFTGSPSTVLVRGVPPNCGRWAITAVSVAATYPDGSTTTRAAVQSANGVWVATLPATATSGRTAAGFKIMADGIDENGAAVTGYILGVADFAVASLGVTPAPEPGETSWRMLYFDAVPSTLRKGDVAKVDGVLKLYNGTAWEAFAGDIPAPSTATPAMDGTGAAGTSAAFARGDHVHPTDTSRMAASATGEDIPVDATVGAQKINAAISGKASKADVDPLLFEQYYPDGSVKSTTEFTQGIKYNAPDTVNRTITVKPFCNTGTAENDNSGLIGRVVIPPFVDGDGNGYISDDGTRYKVVGVSGSEQQPFGGGILTAIVAPDTVTTIGLGAFYDCTALNSVSLPAVMDIGGNALSGCTTLASVSFPTTATIENYAFSSCTSLTSISLPAATTIRAGVFGACSSLTSVDFGDTPRSSVPTLGSNAFNAVPTTCRIIVPYTQYDAWKAADGWKDLPQEFVRHSEKADKPATFTTGNLAKFDSNGNLADSEKKPSDFQSALSQTQLDNIAAVPNKADVSAIPYSLVTKTISNGAVSLGDRAINAVAVSSSLASLTVNFPTATSGKARDFGLRLTVASGITTAPELALPQGVTCENADGEAPEIGADGAATILYFTETASGVFLVKGEVVTAIS